MHKDDQSLPEHVLHEVDEWSNGGFFIFHLDENGNPLLSARCDTNLHASALISFVQNWARAVETLNTQQVIDSLLPPPSEEEEP